MSFPSFLPETPQRPLPGTFFTTPAASRFPTAPQQPIFSQALDPRRRQSTSAPSTGRDQVAPVTTQKQVLAPTQRAARTINEVLQREAAFPELDSYVRREVVQHGEGIKLIPRRGYIFRLRTARRIDRRTMGTIRTIENVRHTRCGFRAVQSSRSQYNDGLIRRSESCLDHD